MILPAMSCHWVAPGAIPHPLYTYIHVCVSLGEPVVDVLVFSLYPHCVSVSSKAHALHHGLVVQHWARGLRGYG